MDLVDYLKFSETSTSTEFRKPLAEHLGIIELQPHFFPDFSHLSNIRKKKTNKKKLTHKDILPCLT